jgi:hypothetical protein
MRSHSIILLFTVLSLSSCKKFLDVKPRTSISDDQTITDANSANTAVRGIYNELESNDYYGYTFQTLGFFSGDGIQYVGSQTVNQQLTNHSVISDLAALSTSWLAIYNTINRANNVLAKVPALASGAGFPDSVKNQLLGEAYFLRALAYFDLARTWGGVQIILKPTVSASDLPTAKRSSLADTYAQVLSDLKAAEPLLSVTTNRIRATRKTVWALLSRYYLYQKDWANAETYASRLIGDANYTLLKPYNSFYANNAANTKESVFELYYNTAVTNTQAYQWQPTTNGGVGWIKPTDTLVSLLNNTAVGGSRSALVQKVVGSTGAVNWYGTLYYRTVGTDPAFLIRIAELYLIRAEARAQQVNFTGANEDLNAIRTRAGVDPVDIQDKDALLLAIEQENQVEFAQEDHRWYDLVRTGRAGTVLGITDARKFLLPIPYAQLAVDANLEQNQGY